MGNTRVKKVVTSQIVVHDGILWWNFYNVINTGFNKRLKLINKLKLISKLWYFIIMGNIRVKKVVTLQIVGHDGILWWDF